MFQKISDWLSECGSHEIYGKDFIVKDFETHTGQTFPKFVTTYTRQHTKATMEARGLGGTLAELQENVKEDRMVWGYVMAQDFARNLANFVSDKHGRGRIFHECIQALREKGL